MITICDRCYYKTKSECSDGKKEAERIKQGNENPKDKEELAMHRNRGVALPREGPQQ